MTNDEAIKLLVNIAAYDIDSQRGEKKFEALWMAIKALEQTRWIPVENGLPEPDEMVLVSCRAKNGRSSVNRAYMDNNCFWHGSGSMSGVVAWQKLPEPYSEE